LRLPGSFRTNSSNAAVSSMPCAKYACIMVSWYRSVSSGLVRGFMNVSALWARPSINVPSLNQPGSYEILQQRPVLAERVLRTHFHP